MKRAAACLVAYSSSEDEDDDAVQPPEILEPQPKKRKLPALSTHLSGPVHIDNPALHQGRTRSTPHIEGQWATHVYIALGLKRTPALQRLVHDIVADARSAVGPALHGIVGVAGGNPGELHISLSRPVFLRAHQREEFKRAVRDIAFKSKPFKLSFAAFSELVNDDRTRAFLTLEVGAGHRELQDLCEALRPVLERFKQKAYYDQPRFHASIAWALLDSKSTECAPIIAPLTEPPTSDSRSNPTPSSTTNNMIVTTSMSDSATPAPQSSSQDFATVPSLPPSLIATLEEKFHAALVDPKVGGVHDIVRVEVKIGKEVSGWRFRGAED